jgi:hypothetical protein
MSFTLVSAKLFVIRIATGGHTCHSDFSLFSGFLDVVGYISFVCFNHYIRPVVQPITEKLTPKEVKNTKSNYLPVVRSPC